MELTEHAATAAEIYRDARLRHVHGRQVAPGQGLRQPTPPDPQHSWPCQRGFERFYGILDGFTNLHHPHRLIERQPAGRGRPVPRRLLPDRRPHRPLPGLVGRTYGPATPASRWFTYLAHPACHAPLHAKPVDIERYRGRYEAGWDALRAERFARQQELGIVAEDTELAPRNTEEGDDVRPWDELADHEQELFARHMEVYAGMVDGLDQYDRPPARRPGRDGRAGQHDRRVHLRQRRVPGRRGGGHQRLLRPPARASPTSRPICPASTCSAGPRPCPTTPGAGPWRRTRPFRLYKINTHAGGHSVPFVLSWPDAPGGPRRAPAPVRPRGRPAAHAAGTDRGRGAVGAQRAAADPDGRLVLRGHPGRGRPPVDPDRAGLRDAGPPRATTGTVGRR